MRGVLNKAAVHLALVAMLLRALLPAGWMPSGATEQHASPIMLCPGMDRMAMPMPAGHDEHPAPQADHAKHGVCIFAAAAPLASPAADVAAPIVTAAVDTVFTQRRDSAVSTSAYRPNAARAPPSLA